MFYVFPAMGDHDGSYMSQIAALVDAIIDDCESLSGAAAPPPSAAKNESQTKAILTLVHDVLAEEITATQNQLQDPMSPFDLNLLLTFRRYFSQLVLSS